MTVAYTITDVLTSSHTRRFDACAITGLQLLMLLFADVD